MTQQKPEVKVEKEVHPESSASEEELDAKVKARTRQSVARSSEEEEEQEEEESSEESEKEESSSIDILKEKLSTIIENKKENDKSSIGRDSVPASPEKSPYKS